VSNLLSNALYYAPAGGSVSCRTEREDGRWRLRISNDAIGLVPHDLSSVSEPFWRRDRVRSDRDRSGLGLSLSTSLAERTRMQLEFELVQERFTATLSGEDSNGSGAPAAQPAREDSERARATRLRAR
jgi:signal transduction histidine kinase